MNNKSINLKNERLNEMKIMNCGMKAKIIEYFTNSNITVQFEDNTIVYKKTYDSFKKGAINNPNIKKYSIRIGEKSYNNRSKQYMEIIEYFDFNNITIKYENGCIVKNVNYNNFKKGNIKNVYDKTFCDIGIIGDEKIDKKSHKYWTEMITRCYNDSALKRKDNYINCNVCEEWKNYSNFKKWYDKNYYELGNEKMQLDKDILVKGNKIYSPETCIFVPKRINTLFIKVDKSRGKYLIGVTLLPNGKYNAQCSYLDDNNNIKRKRKSFKTELEAYNFYKNFKETYIKKVADEYVSKYNNFPKKLYNAMYNWEIEKTD